MHSIFLINPIFLSTFITLFIIPFSSPYQSGPMDMHNFMTQEHSSCQTLSFSTKSPSCHVHMEVYYTSILRDPSVMRRDNTIPKKTFKLYENSIIMCHRESNSQIDTSVDAKIKIANSPKQLAKLSAEGYQIVAELKFHSLPNNKNKFSLQKYPTIYNNLGEDNGSFINNQKFGTNSTVFYHVKGDRMSIKENQIIQNSDLLKFGKEIYQARIYSENIQSIKMAEWSEYKKTNTLKVTQNEGECKFCLMTEGQYSKDYVVSPCKCSGTCSSVHINCLKSWISQRIEIGKKQEKLQTYDMSRFSCEICKQNYPEFLMVNQSLINISPESTVPDDTLVLTKLFPLEDNKRVSHMIKLAKNSNLTIGRHYYNELQMQDMSISRNHAFIHRSQNGKFYLFDKNARFGTFISLKNQIHGLEDAILLTCKQTFTLKLVEEENLKDSASKDDNNEVTAQKIEQ